MKKYALYTLLLALACVIMPVSAQTYVVTSVAAQGSTYLEAEKNVYFGTDASERLVAVKANVDFAVEGGADWCKVEKADKAVKITVSANTDAADRTAKVSLKGKDALACAIEVCQHGTDAEMYPTFAVISDVHFGNSKGDGPMVPFIQRFLILFAFRSAQGNVHTSAMTAKAHRHRIPLLPPIRNQQMAGYIEARLRLKGKPKLTEPLPHLLILDFHIQRAVFQSSDD